MNVLFLVALIFFVIAAIPVAPISKYNFWTAIGLAFLAAGHLWSATV